ncbi:MAG: adenosylmethionine--8-amino-7-oxononanoate transaminase [Sediminibacterium sp.]|nr:adenosylmethionine--8-amino-7-oxononanoate transaminase [Sediminibacterium sp.]
MTLQEKDKAFVWHPFTHQAAAVPPVNIVKGEGLYFTDDAGKRYMDAISSWWVNLHGHCHPYISEKVAEQLQVLEHSMFSDYTHQPAVTLAERLLNHLPPNQSKVFYSDNGSTAVEVALKMAIQYADNLGQKKCTFIAFENAYHGDTFGGMSVGARNVFNQAFNQFLFDVKHIPLPTAENLESVSKILKSLIATGTVAAFIYEPLVQGAAGMAMYEVEHLDALLSICKAEHVICIADEVMTGFGRTGRFFASDYTTIKPDIMCLSKGLTGGYMPLGVTSCAQFIYDAYLSNDKTKTFFHGHSYTANPTACSAALASLDLMEQAATWQAIKRIGDRHLNAKRMLKQHPLFENVRVTGTILALDLKTDEVKHYLNAASEGVAQWFQREGILLRPLGNALYLIPPYCITDGELDYIYKCLLNYKTGSLPVT